MKVVTLLYHDVREDSFRMENINADERLYCLKKSAFESQMELLYKRNISVLSIDELFNFFLKDSATSLKDFINKKVIVLVFDDGWKSNYEIVLPLLKKYNFKATFFITVNYVGKKDMMSWEEIKGLVKEGMSIGSHSLTHRIPTKLTDKELEYELKESKRILEEKLNITCEYFSSPTGFYDKRIEKFAKKAGFKVVCFSKVGLSRIGRKDLLILNKIGIRRNYNLDMFEGIVKEKRTTLLSLRMAQIVRDGMKFLLGENYKKLRSLILKRVS